MAPVPAVNGGMQKSVALVLSLVAVLIVVMAHPAQQTPYRLQPMQQDTLPETGKTVQRSQIDNV